MPFCITVDRTGHDYLRQMCQPSRYLVIDDITSLPKQLPKIYEQLVAPCGLLLRGLNLPQAIG